MKLQSKLAPLGLAAAFTLTTLTGCSNGPTDKQIRDNPSNLTTGDTGLQSKDLIEMTDKMGPSILQCPDIVANPTKCVIVMTNIENKTSDPTEDMTIYLARIRARLMKYANAHVAFVERRATTENLQSTEGAGNTDVFEEGSRGAPQAPTRFVPTYTLKGVFYEKTNNVTSFYLCTFQLTNIKTGQIVWEDSYEVKTLR